MEEMELRVEERDDVLGWDEGRQHHPGDCKVNPVPENEKGGDGSGAHKALVPALVLQNHSEAVEKAVVEGGDEARAPVEAEEDL